ncbi:MAG TPA: ATP-binding protein [Lacunisphaera sp.]|nr:ATP-binding protein [Lacunisphaera sp.]
MTTAILLTAILSLGVGLGVLWANPSRFLNQMFCLGSLLVTVWLWLVFMALSAGLVFRQDPNANPVPWLRANSAIAAFFPWIIWLLKESVVTPDGQSRRALRGSLPWFVMGLALAGLCFTESFIPSDSTPGNSRRGPAYDVYFISSGVLYLVLLILAFNRMRKETGIRKIELQFLSFNGALSGFVFIVLSSVANYLDLRALSRLSPMIILGFYVLTAWAVTFHRIFDARQVFLSVVQRLSLVLVLCLGIIGGRWLFGTILPPPADLLLSVALGSSLAFLLERKTREWFRLSSDQNIAATRRTVIELARSEPSPDKLVAEFETLLRLWGQTSYARLLFDSGEVYASGDLEFAKDRPAHVSLCKTGWSTPESLQRQRAEPGLVDLRQFITEFALGLIVTAPRGSPAPSLLLVLGTKTNHRPFTYPEVQQVQEIAEFMDNILARSRLTMQARQSEQLATIGLLGASLAHEIRNPLVSIKTFAHLLPTRFDDPEFRRRFNLLIPAEVDRIDSLTQQLLDLSNPRRHQMERVSLHAIVRETMDLMLTRATEAHIALASTLTATADTIWADNSAIRQVLINLFINAFQALEPQEGERRVEVRSRNSPNGSVVLEVTDNGPGIAPEHRARLFHPFVSTKTKGMGLGLAVCADILHEHRATIIVPDVGRPGATFRLTFPCPPPSS